MGIYPGSRDDYAGQATTYGPLPDHGRTEVAIVFHTTETRGMPSFGGGDTAPHYVYDPRSREWYVWAEFLDGWVGTLVGHNSGGHGNCKAFQVEILAYSDRNAAASVDGLWVGDFTEGHYSDLAAFVAWARASYNIGPDVTPTPDGGWTYGTSSPHRLSDIGWEAFGGLTCHGAVPGNTHWDVGILDLVRISESDTGGNAVIWRISENHDTYEAVSWLLIEAVSGEKPDGNQPASVQMEAWLGKAAPQLVTVTDLELLADLIGLHAVAKDKLVADGLYSEGKEIAALRSVVYGRP